MTRELGVIFPGKLTPGSGVYNRVAVALGEETYAHAHIVETFAPAELFRVVNRRGTKAGAGHGLCG